MMKFMVQFQLKPGSKEKALATFESVGPNRSAGVSFRNAWVGTRSDVIFVLGESDDLAAVEKVCQSWSQFGEHQIHAVVDIENF
jgi:hypothetical protein